MSDDTTWFWQIVDARGLADVSSDEFVALNELINKAERVEALEMAARAIEAGAFTLTLTVKGIERNWDALSNFPDRRALDEATHDR